MMKWDDLPRDLQLQVIKRFDMDTRIRLGLVFKLRIPDHIKKALRNKLKRPHDCEHYSLVPLGKRRIHASDDSHWVYVLYYYKHAGGDSQWQVHHIAGFMNFQDYCLQDGVWKNA